MKRFSIAIILSIFLFLVSCQKTKPMVSFNTNGGDEIEAIAVEKLGDLPTPNKKGHSFKGWYFDENLTEAYSSESIIKDETILYSKWEVNVYNIKFNIDNYTPVENMNLSYDEIINFPIVMDKEGFNFVGWYLGQFSNEKFESSTMPDSNIELFARWAHNEYKIEMIDYDGKVLGFEMIRHGESFKTKLIPNNHESKLFYQWDGELENITKAGSVVAIYKEPVYISFETYEEAYIEDLKIAYGTSPKVLPISAKKDHNFDGWYLNEQLTVKFDPSTILKNDIKLYPKFIHKDFQEIVIMHGNPVEVDPFDVNYRGYDKYIKQELQLAVEKKYHVKIIYKSYFDRHGWGPARVDGIIKANNEKKPLADIYWTFSDWTKALADANAIADVTPYMEKYGQNINESVREIGTYKNGFYAFTADKPIVEEGLFYNLELLKTLGIDDPASLYLKGEWNWTKFREWSISADALINEDQSVLGGLPGIYAQNMLPLNGGSLINSVNKSVGFLETPALETYSFINQLWTQGLFEPSGTYDAGSYLWQSGNVLMHPGNFSFVSAQNRWLNIGFEMGFVPYPTSDTFKGEYSSEILGINVYNIASGLTKEKEELVFRVWNELQNWKTDEKLKEEHKTYLSNKLSHEASIEAMLSIYDKTSMDFIHLLNISQYDFERGWLTNINKGLKDGSYETLMEKIYPFYAQALEAYLS